MSKTGLLLLIAVLPVIAILFFVYKKDKTKEPMWLLLSFFSKGILSCFLVFTISDVLSMFLPFMNKETEEMLFVEVAIYSFFCVALVEEFCKWLMVYRGGYHHKEFDEIYDILVYSIFVSLGFAFFENIMYVLTSQSIYIALLRAVSAIPGHACDAVFMGYYYSWYHIKDIVRTNERILRKNGIISSFLPEEKPKKDLAYSLIVPVLAHGFYDFCCSVDDSWSFYAFFAFLIYLYITCFRRIRKMSDMDTSDKNMVMSVLCKKYKEVAAAFAEYIVYLSERHLEGRPVKRLTFEDFCDFMEEKNYIKYWKSVMKEIHQDLENKPFDMVDLGKAEASLIIKD